MQLVVGLLVFVAAAAVSGGSGVAGGVAVGAGGDVVGAAQGPTDRNVIEAGAQPVDFAVAIVACVTEHIAVGVIGGMTVDAHRGSYGIRLGVGVAIRAAELVVGAAQGETRGCVAELSQA